MTTLWKDITGTSGDREAYTRSFIFYATPSTRFDYFQNSNGFARLRFTS